jgi:Cid1 family poly A polymerase
LEYRSPYYANTRTALGGTLSSYTWICMIINFLQTRDPPVLPALQQNPSLQPKFVSGLNVAFDKDIISYRCYGSQNTDSLAVLLFQFFRYYAHEIDFEMSVMSVRAGKVITKLEKNWHLLQDNRLCVEEPFNTARNLGNTADDTSVRGIHLELRRAFQMVAEANLAKCCDQYEAPANLIDAQRPLERHSVPINRPIVPQSAATLGRAGRGGSRGGKQNFQLHRNSNSGRRASSASTRGHGYPQPLSLTSTATQAELSLQAQQQQYLLHDHLFQQYQLLQAQEQELRAQLHQQAVLQGRMVQNSPYPHFLLPYGAYAGGHEELMRARAGTINQPPLTAPIRPQGFAFQSSSSHGGRTSRYGSTTNPPSPLLQNVLPDSRRSYRRSSMTNGSSGGSLRAHSQPPRPVPSQLSFPTATERHHELLSGMPYNLSGDLASSIGGAQVFADAATGSRGHLYQTLSPDRRGSEYIGYYLGRSPPLPTYSRSVIGSPYPSSTSLIMQNGGISPQVLAQVPSNPLTIPPLTSELTRPPSVEAEVADSEPTNETSSQDVFKRPSNLSRSSSGPVVVNGTINMETERQQKMNDLQSSLTTMNFDTSASDGVAVDTPSSSDSCSQGLPEPFIADNTEISQPGTNMTLSMASLQQKGSRKATRRVNGHAETHGADSVPNSLIGPASAGNQLYSVSLTNQVRDGTSRSREETRSNEENPSHTLALPLSPVKEMPTPSPTKNKRLSVAEDSVPALSKPKIKGKAKQKKSPGPVVGQGEDKPGTLSNRPNGLMSAAPILTLAGTGGPGVGWQTQKKKSRHKKGSKSETDLKKMNSAGGDFRPLDESLRKGG